jgi:hypothetical protein
MWIRDGYPGSDFFHPGSKIDKISDPGPGSASKNLNHFKFKKIRSGMFIPDLRSRVLDLDFFHTGSQIRIPDPGFKKVPDAESGFRDSVK